MNDLKTVIHNLETDEIVERNMTSEEIAQRELDIQNSIAAEEFIKQKQIIKSEAKAALLAKLGITEEEAKLLLS